VPVLIKLYEPWVVEPPRFARILVPAVRRSDLKPVAVWLDRSRVKGFVRCRGETYVEYETGHAAFYSEKLLTETSCPGREEARVEVFRTEARARNFSRAISDYNPDFEGFVPPVLVEHYRRYVKTNIHPDLGVLD
jgi:hypothetical protein